MTNSVKIKRPVFIPAFFNFRALSVVAKRKPRVGVSDG